MAFAPAAHAIDWLFEPNLYAAATVTDNVNQSESNRKDALILNLMPGFTLQSKGSRRVQASLQYGLSSITRFGADQHDDLFHNLNAVGHAELIDDFLFVDGSANISQQLISLLGPLSDAATNSSNRATVGTYSLSPYVVKRLGTFARAQVRYTASGAIFQNDVSNNTTANAFLARLDSGTRFTDFTWSLNYDIRKATYHNAPDATFERAYAQAGYALTRKFRVFGTVGQDWNDYLSSTGTSGSSYSVGFGWAPSRRTDLEASVGERYFGRTYSLAGSHRTRLSRWTARYYEDVSDISQQLLSQSSRIFWECPAGSGQLFEAAEPPLPNCKGPISSGQLATFFNSLGIPLSQLIKAGLLNTSIVQGIFIIKGLDAGVSWDIGRLGFGLSVQDTRRLYQLLSGAQDRIQGVTGSASYRLSPTTTANSSLSLTRISQDFGLGGALARQDDIWSLYLGLNRRYTAKLDGALAFRHTKRNSNVANSNFDENSLTASVNMRF